jgi:hypothetical protein
MERDVTGEKEVLASMIMVVTNRVDARTEVEILRRRQRLSPIYGWHCRKSIGD